MRTSHFQCEDAGSIPAQVTGFVGVTANITDCRSVATGSTPVRTATIAAFQWLDAPGKERYRFESLPGIPKPCSLKGKAAENAKAAECMDDAVMADRLDG